VSAPLAAPRPTSWVEANGAFRGVAASVARLGYQIAESSKPNQTVIVIILSLLKYAHPLIDRSWVVFGFINSWCSSITEQAIGVAVACMPTMPAFFRHVFKGPKPRTLEPNQGAKSSFADSDSRNRVRPKQGDSYNVFHSEHQELHDVAGQRK
jgi:hypothetical protein